MSSAVRPWRLVPWFAVLVGVIAGFHHLGTGPLAAPPSDVAGWGPWLAARDPFVATVAVLRLLVLALAWYLLVAATAGLLARLLRSARAIRVVDACTLPPLRRLLEASVGVALAVGVVGAAAPGAVATRVASPAVALAAAEPAEGADPVDPPATPPAGERGRAGPLADAEMAVGPTGRRPPPLELLARREQPPGPRELGPPAFARTASSPSAGPASPAWTKLQVAAAGLGVEVPARPLATGEDPAPEVLRTSGTGRDGGPSPHVVTPGESLWSIARDALAVALGRAPTDAEIVPYWREVVASQRPLLVDPDDPDLIHPGDVVWLHAPSGTPS